MRDLTNKIEIDGPFLERIVETYQIQETKETINDATQIICSEGWSVQPISRNNA